MTYCQRTWHRGVHIHFLPPTVLLPWLSSMSSCGSHSVCYPMVSIGSDVYPSAKCTQSCRHPLPLKCYLKSSTILSGCSSVHPQEKWWVPVDSAQGSLVGLMLDDCQTTIFLWHSLAVTPLGSRLNWGGAGTSDPCLVDTHTQGNASFWHEEEKLVAM